MLIGRPGNLQSRTCTKTTATGPSPMSRKNPDWDAQAGRRASAWATTTTTAGTISSAAFGGTTFCFTTTPTARLQRSLAKPASTTNRSAGAPAALGSTTTVMGAWIFSYATT